MTKILIENALRHVILANNLHDLTLRNGRVHQRENQFTIPMAPLGPNCWEQVTIYTLFGDRKIIDLVCFANPIPNGRKPVIRDARNPNIICALEAKHYSPHQSGTLLTYLRYSVGGCIKDILKLVDCGFAKFYILQIQTHVTNYKLLGGATFGQMLLVFPFLQYYVGATPAAAAANMNQIIAQNRIVELERYSRQHLDRNLRIGNISQLVISTIASVDLTIHYLISGPFYYTNLYPRLAAVLDPALPFEGQVGGGGLIPTWDVDVLIASDPLL